MGEVSQSQNGAGDQLLMCTQRTPSLWEGGKSENRRRIDEKRNNQEKYYSIRARAMQ